MKMMEKKIIFVTGGQRSGKSQFAEKLILKIAPNPVYVATAQVYDGEMADRVRKHQIRRGENWSTIEETLSLGEIDIEGRAALVECLTMWTTNIFFDQKEDVDASFRYFKEQFAKLISQNSTIIFVTNEIGLGGISGNAMQRHFTDLMGMVNRHVATVADEAYLLLSGIPVKIK